MVANEILDKKTETPSAEPAVRNPEKQEPFPSNNGIFYRGLFATLNEGFAYCKVVFDDYGKPIDCIFLDTNEAFMHLVNLDGKSVIGGKVTDLHPNVKQESFDWIGVCSSVAVTGKGLTFERRSKNSGKWLSLNVFSPEKGYFAVLLKDVTQRKKTEQALKQSKKQYKQLASSLNDTFFALNSSLKIIYWNKTCEKFTKISAEKALGQHFFDVFGKNKESRKAARIYANVMKNRRTKVFVGNLPKVSGDVVFEIQINPTGNGVSVFAKDVTERKKLEATLQQYTQRLEELVKDRTEKLKYVERLAAIGETAGMIGHDIRNPLQSIISEVYLTKDDLKELPESEAKKRVAESIQSIEEQTLYINKIVTDLQDYAKPLVPISEEINLEQIIQGVSASLATDKVKVSYYIEKRMATFMTDASFIKRILTNLTLNGIQAMQEKEGGELTINVFQRARTVIIAVSDNGGGIPDSAKEKIFKPLFTTKSKGQGFGLAVVKKLVEALNGYIAFETEVGKGTTFIVEIPSR
jgi:PAS domain S-box-containing protein